MTNIHLLGIKLTLCTRDELLEAVRGFVVGKRKALVLSGNAHSFNLAYENRWLRDFFDKADIVRLDGAGLRLGAWMMGYRTAPRMTWADFAWDLAEHCERHGISLFLLGAAHGVAAKSAQRLQARFPKLTIAGTHHGYFDKSAGADQNEEVVRTINACSPDILIAGFGMPLQEDWLLRNFERLDVRVAFTGGAVFDYLSGELPRGPRWMCRTGFEWLARLLIEPRRLWRRYLIGNTLFLCRILQARFRKERP